MGTLFLVKHSLPEIQRHVPPELWRLSEEGRFRAERLAEKVEGVDVARVVSSDEPKALETAAVIARRLRLSVETAEGLHEHRLAGEWFETRESFERAVERFFATPEARVLGKESAREAGLRFDAALRRVLGASREGSSLVVVSHGRVTSLFAAPRFGWEPVALWRQLGLPSLVTLTLPELRAVEVAATFAR